MEGRNRDQVMEILSYLNQIRQAEPSRNRFTVSVEVEKVGRNFEDFIPHADVVFISKVNNNKLLCVRIIFIIQTRNFHIFIKCTF
jgi:hypothetical protein